ncbi:MAG: YceI family protein [Acidimicrobiales bacterium]
MARYVISPERSQVWIDARSNVHPIHSNTSGLEGYVELALDSDGAIDVTATPVGKLSLSVDRLSSGNRMEDRELQKRIDARRYPTIEGVLADIERDGNQASYKVSGDITFRGVSKRHEDVMVIRAIDDTTISLEGSSRFDIREFGMQPPKVLMLKVEPEVDIRVEIFAEKES